MIDIELITAKLTADILAIEIILHSIPIIEDQVKKFDGKVFNIKLATSINEMWEEKSASVEGSFGNSIDGYVIIEVSGDDLSILIRPSNTSLLYTSSRNKSAWIASESYSRVIIPCKDCLNNKRIVSDKIIQQVKICEERYRDQIIRINTDKDNLPERAKKRDDLLKAIQDFNESSKSNTGHYNTRILLRSI